MSLTRARLSVSAGTAMSVPWTDLASILSSSDGRGCLYGYLRAMDEGDKAGLGIAQRAGNNIVALDLAETQRWRRTAATVETDWINEMKGKNIDGAKLVSKARALIAKHSK